MPGPSWNAQSCYLKLIAFPRALACSDTQESWPVLRAGQNGSLAPLKCSPWATLTYMYEIWYAGEVHWDEKVSWPNLYRKMAILNLVLLMYFNELHSCNPFSSRFCQGNINNILAILAILTLSFSSMVQRISVIRHKTRSCCSFPLHLHQTSHWSWILG